MSNPRTQYEIDLENFLYENSQPCIELDAYMDIYTNKTVATSTCTYGYHKWQWYEGLHMERYWFCTVCDEKDYKRDPPPPVPKR
jgi:hypothetical protein